LEQVPPPVKEREREREILNSDGIFFFGCHCLFSPLFLLPMNLGPLLTGRLAAVAIDVVYNSPHLLPDLFERHPQLSPYSRVRMTAESNDALDDIRETAPDVVDPHTTAVASEAILAAVSLPGGDERNEYTLVGLAVLRGQPGFGSLAYFLSRPDFDPNIPGSGLGQTPLMLACHGSYLPTIYALANDPRTNVNAHREGLPKSAPLQIITKIKPEVDEGEEIDAANMKSLWVYRVLALMTSPHHLDTSFVAKSFWNPEKDPPPPANLESGALMEMALRGSAGALMTLWNRDPGEVRTWGRLALERTCFAFTKGGSTANSVYRAANLNMYFMIWKRGQRWEPYSTELRFLKAVKDGNTAMLGNLMEEERPISVNHIFGSGDTLLSMAIIEDKPQIVAWLLNRHRAEINPNQRVFYLECASPLILTAFKTTTTGADRGLICDYLMDPVGFNVKPPELRHQWLNIPGISQPARFIPAGADRKSDAHLSECMVLLLQDSRTDPNLPDRTGRTPALILSTSRNMSGLRLLLAYSRSYDVIVEGRDGTFMNRWPGDGFPLFDGGDIRRPLVPRLQINSIIETMDEALSNAADIAPNSNTYTRNYDIVMELMEYNRDSSDYRLRHSGGGVRLLEEREDKAELEKEFDDANLVEQKTINALSIAAAKKVIPGNNSGYRRLAAGHMWDLKRAPKRVLGSEIFALAIYVTDGYLAATTRRDENSTRIARFFSIMARLPMELQNILSARTAGSLVDQLPLDYSGLFVESRGWEERLREADGE
jgi:hypothetical protein